MPQLTNRDSYILVFDYPAAEVTRFMLDGAEEFHELSQAFFHYVAWTTSGNATLFDLKAAAGACGTRLDSRTEPCQGADPGSGDILLVDPCLLRGDGEQAVKDSARELIFEGLHRRGSSDATTCMA